MWLFLFLLFLLAVVVATFSRAKECYECGSRDPSVYSAAGTMALCDSCWVSGEQQRNTEKAPSTTNSPEGEE